MWAYLTFAIGVVLFISPTTVQADCGRTPNPPTKNHGRIVGGETAAKFSWPWQGALCTERAGRCYPWCGASLIDPQWVITTASCVSRGSGDTRSRVLLGAYSRLAGSILEPSRVQSAWKEVHVHPLWKAIGDGRQPFDFALIKVQLMKFVLQGPNNQPLRKLDKAVELTDKIQTVCLPKSDENATMEGTAGYATGWGLTKSPSVRIKLRQVRLQFSSNDRCVDFYQFPINDTQLCAGGSPYGGSLCDGDFGGPLVRQNGQRWFQYGVGAFVGNAECDSFPSVFTRVARMCDFILSTTGKELCL